MKLGATEKKERKKSAVGKDEEEGEGAKGAPYTRIRLTRRYSFISRRSLTLQVWVKVLLGPRSESPASSESESRESGVGSLDCRVFGTLEFFLLCIIYIYIYLVVFGFELW